MKVKISLIILSFLACIHSDFLLAQTLELDYSTYLGGAVVDRGYGIALDSANCIYVAGKTESPDFPTLNPYQSEMAGGNKDAFVTKLSSSGSSLIYSTYLGGEGWDEARSIAVDSNNFAYVTGYTGSSNFPLENPYQTSESCGDAFVTKLASSGSSLIFSTYLGGWVYESSRSIVVDSNFCAYVTGFTNSSSFPKKDPYQGSIAGIYDAFVTKFTSDGSSLIYSTFFGGNLDEGANGIVLDSSNNIYITGFTESTDLPLCNAYQASFAEGSSDAFVTCFSASGSSLIYSTYLGGGGDENYLYPSYPCLGAGSITVDSDACAYVTGDTESSDFPIRSAYQGSNAGSSDTFITKFSPSGTSLVYSTYLGGESYEKGYGIAVDSTHRAYIIGYTGSSNFPTRNPYQPSRYPGSADVFITSFNSTGSSLLFSTFLGGNESDRGQDIALGPGNSVHITGQTKSIDFPTKNPYQSSYAGGSYPDEGDVFVCKFKWVTPPTPTPTPEIPTPIATPTCGPATAPPEFIMESGDYNGDGTSDIAIFRDNSGMWAVRGITRVYFGAPGDKPASGDYVGNKITDVALYRPSAGLWAIRGISRVYFGSAGDFPCPGDFDGNGSADVGIFRETSGMWAIRDLTRAYFGASQDRPVPGDYTGSGTKLIGIYRPASGLWALRNVSRVYFGGAEDWTLPADYDGDGSWDIVVFRPSRGLWALRDITRLYFGCCLDWPQPADYDGDSTDDPGIFRDSSGLWAVRGITRAYYGSSGDIPVTR